MILIYLLCLFHLYFADDYIVDLTKEKWNIINKNGSISLKGQNAGLIHTILHSAKIIGSPYYRYNDMFQSYFLVSEGLDTITSIKFNTKKVADTSNMFVKYAFDVTESVSEQNTIEITFFSPLNYVDQFHSSYPYEVPASDNIGVQRGEKYRNYIRKEQCSFSWDWGPCFPSSGIYRDLYIVGFKDMTVSYFGVDVIYVEGSSSFDIDIAVHIDSNVEKIGEVVDVVITDLGIHKQTKCNLAVGENICEVKIEKITNAKLWMPNGLGEPNLYEIELTINSIKETKRIGFRDVKMVQEKINEDEYSFYFLVNGIKVFSQGGNMIPMDSFEDRITKKDLDRLIQSSIEANMNTIRVWGGGIYQSDEFYDLCDEKGLMVWQEFMFACSLYPVNEDFLDSVGSEIRTQIRRLKHHPSVVLWSGSNENEVSLWDKTWYHVVNKDNKILYVIDYAKLYFETIRPIVIEEDKYRFFWSSSPSNGIISTDPYVGKWTYPGSTAEGDVHYYNYDAKCTDVKNFPKAKFMSEYGWQGFPSFYSIKNISVEADWDLKSPLMDHRQHHGSGTDQILKMMDFFFHQCDLKGVDKFKAQIYLSQVLQLMCIGTETQYYRTIMESDHTMGALYWQLNDIWQAPTWASCEKNGKWKLLHYEIQKSFSPILLSGYQVDDMFKLFLVDNLFSPSPISMDVDIKAYSITSGKVVGHLTYKHKISYLEVNDVISEKTLDLIKRVNCSDGSDCLIIYEASDSNETFIESYHFFSELKDSKIQKPTITIKSMEKYQTKNVKIVLQTNQITPYFYCEVDILGKFDKNGILMLPGKEYEFIFQNWEDNLDFDYFQKTFFYLSIRDTYN